MTVTNPKGKVVELPTQKKPEGYGTTFTPTEQGPHKVNVNFAGQEVPRSPFSVDVQPKANVGAVKVKGLETRKFSMVLLTSTECSQEHLSNMFPIRMTYYRGTNWHEELCKVPRLWTEEEFVKVSHIVPLSRQNLPTTSMPPVHCHLVIHSSITRLKALDTWLQLRCFFHSKSTGPSCSKRH